jgi:hypothetical protein
MFQVQIYLQKLKSLIPILEDRSTSESATAKHWSLLEEEDVLIQNLCMELDHGMIRKTNNKQSCDEGK